VATQPTQAFHRRHLNRDVFVLRHHVSLRWGPNSDGSWHWSDMGLRLFNEYGMDIVGRKSLPSSCNATSYLFSGGMYMNVIRYFGRAVITPCHMIKISHLTNQYGLINVNLWAYYLVLFDSTL
jgi:hypothetical protein